MPRGARKARKVGGRRRRYVRRYRGRRYNLPKLGFLSVARKMPPCAIISSVTGGAASFVGPVGFDLFEVNPMTAPATPSIGTVGGYYDVPFAVTVRFNQITAPGEFSALFDTYRIKGVKIQLQNNFNTVLNSTTGTPAGYMPYIEYVYDDDDANALPVAQFREKMGIKTKYFNATNNKLTINLIRPKPRIATETAISTGNPLIIPSGMSWVNMASTSVPHFGIKGVIRRMYLPAGSSTSSINIDATMYFDVKDVQ